MTPEQDPLAPLPTGQVGTVTAHAGAAAPPETTVRWESPPARRAIIVIAAFLCLAIAIAPGKGDWSARAVWAVIGLMLIAGGVVRPRMTMTAAEVRVRTLLARYRYPKYAIHGVQSVDGPAAGYRKLQLRVSGRRKPRTVYIGRQAAVDQCMEQAQALFERRPSGRRDVGAH